MLNNTFNCGVFFAGRTAVMGDRGRSVSISLQEVSVCIIDHCTVEFLVAQGTSVPIFNGSPPLK